jgi:hypothetical protein
MIIREFSHSLMCFECGIFQLIIPKIRSNFDTVDYEVEPGYP